MFRRKDEFDMDGGSSDGQGSLLGEGAAEPDTVKVLSDQKAAEYKADQQTGQQSAPKPASGGASFSSPAAFGQIARPISQALSQPAAQPAAPSVAASEPVRQQPFNPASAASSARPTPASASPAGANATPRPLADNSFRGYKPEASRATPSSNFSPSSNINQESPAMLNNKHNQNERVLTVGNDIMLKGEITTCDRLVIEGNVDATVSDVNKMELAESGSFHGTAEVEYAEISGTFEGNLTVRGSLVIHRSGKISGTITYGDIEIARGGTITGDIKVSQVSASQIKEEKIAA